MLFHVRVVVYRDPMWRHRKLCQSRQNVWLLSCFLNLFILIMTTCNPHVSESNRIVNVFSYTSYASREIIYPFQLISWSHCVKTFNRSVSTLIETPSIILSTCLWSVIDMKCICGHFVRQCPSYMTRMYLLRGKSIFSHITEDLVSSDSREINIFRTWFITERRPAYFMTYIFFNRICIRNVLSSLLARPAFWVWPICLMDSARHRQLRQLDRSCCVHVAKKAE